MVVTAGGASVVAVLSGLLGLAPDVPIQRPGDVAETPPARTAGTSAPAETPAASETTEAPAPVDPSASVALGSEADPGEAVASAESVAETPPAPTVPTDPHDAAAAYAAATHDLDDRDRQLRRASSLIAGGAVAATAGLVMLIGAATEAAKPACKFGLDSCANAPRPAIARGLGIGSAIALVGGAAMIGFGLHRRHRLRTGFGGTANSVALTVAGRF